MAPHKDRANPAAPEPLALAATQLSFIQSIIDKTLVKQPQSVQAVVLFIFVFLFAYMVFFTTNGSIILSTKLRVPPTEEQARTVATGLGSTTGFAIPERGYEILYGDRYYGLNRDGQVRIDVPIGKYLWALAFREMSFDVRPPGVVEYKRLVKLKGLDLEPVVLGEARSSGAMRDFR